MPSSRSWCSPSRRPPTRRSVPSISPVTQEPNGSDHAVVVSATTSDAGQIPPQSLGVYRRSDLDDQYRAKPGATSVHVLLEKFDAVTYRGIVALPSNGEWVVVPFADLDPPTYSPLAKANEYPIVSFSVPWSGSSTRIQPPSSSAKSNTWAPLAAIGGGAVVAGLIVFGGFQLIDRRRAPSAVMVGTDEATDGTGEVAPPVRGSIRRPDRVPKGHDDQADDHECHPGQDTDR